MPAYSCDHERSKTGPSSGGATAFVPTGLAFLYCPDSHRDRNASWSRTRSSIVRLIDSRRLAATSRTPEMTSSDSRI